MRPTSLPTRRLALLGLGFVVLFVLAQGISGPVVGASVPQVPLPSSPPSPGSPANFHSVPSRSAAATHPPTDLGVVYTTDPLAGDNQYLFGTLGIPFGNLVPGQNWTFLLAEPFNATTSIAVGVVGWQNGSAPEWEAEYFVWNSHGRPANTTVVESQAPMRPGSQADLNFLWDQGNWWSFWVGGSLVSGAGGNGTVDLGAPRAVGYSATAPLVQWPSVVVEGNTTDLPFTVDFSSVLEFNATENPVDTENGTWLAQNGIWWQSAPGWHMGGEDQLGPALPLDGTMWKVWFGQGEPIAPANGTWVWGLGGRLFQPYANVTVQGAYAANTGFGVDLTLNSSDFGPDAASYLVTIWERLAPGLAIGVGDWVNAPGGTNIVYYERNVSGTVIQYVSDTSPPVGGIPILLLAFPIGGGDWNFTDNGATMLGGEDSYALGGTYVGPSVAPQGSPTFVTIESWNESAASATPLALSPTIEFNVSGTWQSAPEGWVGPTVAPPCSPCAGAPIEGYDQDPLLVPGETTTYAALPTLPVGSVLWNGLSFPTPNVLWTNIPSQVGSFQNLTADIWVNGSSGEVIAPRVTLDLPSGVLAGPVHFASSGEAQVNLTFPVGTGAIPLTFQATGSAPGYVPGIGTTTTTLVRGNLTLTGHPEEAGLAPGQTGNILLWVNATDGAGPRTDVAWGARSALGASLTDDGLVAGTTAYQFSYVAPATTATEDDTVAFLAGAPGFISALGTVSVLIEPPAMVLQAQAAPNPVYSDGTLRVAAWLNTTEGVPLSGATLTAGFLATGLVGVATSSPVVGEYLFTVVAPVVAVDANLTFLVGGSVLGYQAQTVSSTISVVLRPILLQVAVAPPVGGSYEVVVQSTSFGAPVPYALALLSPSAGSLTAGEVAATSSGYTNFTWTPPAGQGGTYAFVLTVSAPGYITAGDAFTIVVPSSASSTPTPGLSLLWLLIGPAIVLLVFLVLWDYGRRKSRRETVEKPSKGEGKGEPKPEEKKWAPEEGSKPGDEPLAKGTGEPGAPGEGTTPRSEVPKTGTVSAGGSEPSASPGSGAAADGAPEGLSPPST